MNRVPLSHSRCTRPHPHPAHAHTRARARPRPHTPIHTHLRPHGYTHTHTRILHYFYYKFIFFLAWGVISFRIVTFLFKQESFPPKKRMRNCLMLDPYQVRCSTPRLGFLWVSIFDVEGQSWHGWWDGEWFYVGQHEGLGLRVDILLSAT